MAQREPRPKSSLALRHELPYYRELPKGTDIFEGGPQHLVLAKADGCDMMFWLSPYILDGRTRDGFLAEDAATLHVMLVLAPQKDRGKMNDTNFICRGWNPSEYLKASDLKVTSTKNEAVWKLKNTEFVCHPPYWEVRGREEGIAYDLKITGTAPTSFYIGDLKKVHETRVAVFNQFTSCTGSVRVGGKTYNIQGYGCHEHPVVAMPMGKRLWQEAAANQMHYWIVGGGHDVQLFCFVAGEASKGYGRVVVDGKYLAYDSGVTLDVLDWWHDPRSLVTIPCKWHINMRSSHGVLDAHATASGRAHYFWCLRNGYVLNNWLLGTLSGSFAYPNGRAIPIKDVLFGVQWLRAIVAAG